MVQRDRGTVGTEEQWVQRNSEYRGIVGTEEQWYRGTVGTEEHTSLLLVQYLLVPC